MSLFSGFGKTLGNAIVPATDALAAHNSFLQREDDKQRAEALQSLMLARQAKQDELTQALGQRTLRTPVLGDPNYAGAMGAVKGAEATAEIPAAVDKARQLAPVEVDKAAKTAQALSPITTQTAINTAKGVSPITTQTAINTARGEAPIKTAQAIATAKGTADYAAPIATQDRPGDPSSPVTYKTRSEALGTGKATGTGGGGQSLAPEDRAKMLNQAKLDNQTMKAYEAKVLAGQAHVGVGAGLAGASADAHGGVVNNMIGIAGNAATGAMDPEYQRYLTAQRSYGRIMGNLQSKRYTDHQAEIERSISGIQGADLPGTIQYKQQLRDASLADPIIAPSSGGRGSGPGGKTTTINGKTYVVPD